MRQMIMPVRRPALFFLFGMFLIASLGTAFASAASGRVFDRAGLLSAGEIQTLQILANEFCYKSGLDIVLVTTDNAEGKTARQYADDFYDTHDFGVGDDKSGLLFLIDMDNREIHISTTGRAIPIFTQQRIDAIIDSQYDKLKNGQYYETLRIGLNTAFQIARPPETAQQQSRPPVQSSQPAKPVQQSAPAPKPQQSALQKVAGPSFSTASEKKPSGGPFLLALAVVLFFVSRIYSSYRKGFHANGPGTSFNCTIQITRREDTEISKTTVPYYNGQAASAQTAAAVATLAAAALTAASSTSSSSRSSSGSSSSSSSSRSHGGGGRSFSSSSSSSSRPHGGGGRKF